MNSFTVESFKVGDRVELHPATDDWMRGDRYGEVVKLGVHTIKVTLDKSGKTRRIFPEDIATVVSQ